MGSLGVWLWAIKEGVLGFPGPIRARNPLVEAIWTPVKAFSQSVIQFLPHVLAFVAVVLLGWVLARIVQWTLERTLQAVGFNELSHRLGLTHLLQRWGIHQQPSRLVPRVVYWAMMIMVFIIAMDALDWPLTDQLMTSFFGYLPHVVVALLILLLGYGFSNYLARATLIGAVTSGIPGAKGLAKAVRLAVLLFAFAMAFEQLGIATGVVLAAFVILFGGIVLALAIAIGLGAQGIVREALEQALRREQKEKEEQEPISHL